MDSKLNIVDRVNLLPYQWWAFKSIDFKANLMRKQFDLQQLWLRFSKHQNMKMYRKC